MLDKEFEKRNWAQHKDFEHRLYLYLLTIRTNPSKDATASNWKSILRPPHWFQDINTKSICSNYWTDCLVMKISKSYRAIMGGRNTKINFATKISDERSTSIPSNIYVFIFFFRVRFQNSNYARLKRLISQTGVIKFCWYPVL